MEDLLRIIIGCAISVLLSYVISVVIYSTTDAGILITVVWALCCVAWFAYAASALAAWLSGKTWSELATSFPFGWWWLYATLLLFSGPAVQEIRNARRRRQS